MTITTYEYACRALISGTGIHIDEHPVTGLTCDRDEITLHTDSGKRVLGDFNNIWPVMIDGVLWMLSTASHLCRITFDNYERDKPKQHTKDTTKAYSVVHTSGAHKQTKVVHTCVEEAAQHLYRAVVTDYRTATTARTAVIQGVYTRTDRFNTCICIAEEAVHNKPAKKQDTRNYYGFEHNWGSTTCVSNAPHGDCGTVHVFNSIKARDEWIAEGPDLGDRGERTTYPARKVRKHITTGTYGEADMTTRELVDVAIKEAVIVKPEE